MLIESTRIRSRVYFRSQIKGVTGTTFVAGRTFRRLYTHDELGLISIVVTAHVNPVLSRCLV
jgi:hypothetical protein